MERTKVKIGPLAQEAVKATLLQLAPAEEKPEQNCAYRLDFQSSAGWVRVKQFTNGTLYLEATDADLYQRALDAVQQITGVSAVETPKLAAVKPAGNGKTDKVIDLDQQAPYIGTDESGKGDYFGPLVIAGVMVTPRNAEILKTLGVMDSKQLTDKQMPTLANEIEMTVGPSAWSVVEIGPKKYNELYDKFKGSGKNLNHLLAWGHARVIENLVMQNPDCKQALADQFGNERYILTSLQQHGKQVQLYQTHRAEAYTGVAAASILARVRFTQKLRRLGDQWGVRLSLGANPRVVEEARAFIRQHGKEQLGEVAKLHFKTTETL